MYLIVEENPNCAPEERMFRESGSRRLVERLELEKPDGKTTLCDVRGVEDGGAFGPAYAVQVEDSGAGTAWLIYGGNWGLRFRETGQKDEWSLKNPSQWGEPFLVLDINTYFQSLSRYK
jgi:hypothetical protein